MSFILFSLLYLYLLFHQMICSVVLAVPSLSIYFSRPFEGWLTPYCQGSSFDKILVRISRNYIRSGQRVSFQAPSLTCAHSRVGKSLLHWNRSHLLLGNYRVFHNWYRLDALEWRRKSSNWWNIWARSSCSQRFDYTQRGIRLETSLQLMVCTSLLEVG